MVLVGVWSGAAAGIVFTLLWTDAPKWLTAGAYVALGWFSIIAVPQITERAGAGALALLALGGLAYTAGAVVYARRRLRSGCRTRGRSRRRSRGTRSRR